VCAAKSFPVCILTDIALHVRSAGAKHKIHQILLYIPLDITKRALIARIYRIIQRYRIKLFFHSSSSIPQLLAPLSLFYGHPPQRVQIAGRQNDLPQPRGLKRLQRVNGAVCQRAGRTGGGGVRPAIFSAVVGGLIGLCFTAECGIQSGLPENLKMLLHRTLQVQQ